MDVRTITLECHDGYWDASADDAHAMRGNTIPDVLLQLAYYYTCKDSKAYDKKTDQLINALSLNAHNCGLCHAAARALTKITWGQKYEVKS